MRHIEMIPLLSEKSRKLVDNKKYAFLCPISVTKPEIKRAVEKMFGVKVEKVNTMVYRGKIKRRGFFLGKRPNFKKVVVSLKEGSIDFAKITQRFSETLAKK
ncbi:MAG: 50S ribosomal protein L23 [bacterium]|nr:50S ribosomal protein L23 [bacterium]